MGCILGLILAFGAEHEAQAGPIPYPDSGTYNSTVYSFTAASTGDVIAYFAGSGATYDNQLGMLDNGVLTSAGYGLDNHTSAIGQSFDLGHVTAGDSLVFVLHNLTLAANAYSDPSLNVAYDSPDDTIGHNHIYATTYTATPPLFAGVPAGMYVGFEDLPFPGADFNYTDETFVFTNVQLAGAVPEPSSLALCGIAGVIGLAVVRVRLKQVAG
jgi:PEP-CTERM motif